MRRGTRCLPFPVCAAFARRCGIGRCGYSGVCGEAAGARPPVAAAGNQPLTNARGGDYTPRPGSRVPDVHRPPHRLRWRADGWPRTTEAPWTGGIRTRLFLFLMRRGSTPRPRQTRSNHGTHDDAAPCPHRPTRPPGGHHGPFRHGAVVRGGSAKATRRLRAAGSRYAGGMDGLRAGHAWIPGASGQFDRAGSAGAVQAAREDRGTPLSGRDLTSHRERRTFRPARAPTQAGRFSFPDSAGGGWDDSRRQLAVNAGAGGAWSPDAGGQTRPLAQGRSVPAGPKEWRSWLMVAVAQRSERRIVDPETRVRLPSATPARRARIQECP